MLMFLDDDRIFRRAFDSDAWFDRHALVQNRIFDACALLDIGVCHHDRADDFRIFFNRRAPRNQTVIDFSVNDASRCQLTALTFESFEKYVATSFFVLVITF